MDKLPNPEQILTSWADTTNCDQQKILSAMKEYGDLMWDAALDWTIENHKLKFKHANPTHGDEKILDEQSILKGKKK